eukprot:Sspe_Gene.4862::Locus_1611_Transcript_1_1_Confidence_1.000_Length_6620::g.4862::m.4862
MAEPHALLDHLGNGEAPVRQRRPPTLQHNLADGPHQPRSGLRDVHHVSHQCESVELQLADVRLQQHVDLSARIVDGFLDGNRHTLQKLLQLQLLLVPHAHVLELIGHGEKPEDLEFVHRGLQVLIELHHRTVREVVVRGDLPQVCGLERPALAVVLDQRSFVKCTCCGVHQVGTPLLELRVVFHVLPGHTVQLGPPQHSDVEVRVPQPVVGILGVLNCAQDDLSVELVHQPGDELRLNGQLLVHEAQVVLQLRAAGNDDTLPLLVELNPPCPTHHLHGVQGAQLYPLALFGVVDLRPFDDDSVGRKVHPPRQGGGGHQDLKVLVSKELFHEHTVLHVQPSVVDPKTVREEVTERPGPSPTVPLPGGSHDGTSRREGTDPMCLAPVPCPG